MKTNKNLDYLTVKLTKALAHQTILEELIRLNLNCILSIQHQVKQEIDIIEFLLSTIKHPKMAQNVMNLMKWLEPSPKTTSTM